MEQYLKMHVKQCRFEARVDIYGDEATALEKGARADTSKGIDKVDVELVEALTMPAKEDEVTKRVPKIVVCPICGKKVAKSRLKQHAVRCTMRQRHEEDLLRKRKADAIKMAMDAASGLVSREEAATRLGLMEPDPPKNVKCVATTACTIELSWDAPVFTGGVPLDDYVISYSLVHKKYEGKKEIRTLEEMPELPTSRWYAIDPIAETGYTIKFLQADTEYTDIIVRAKNPIGLSAPSKAVEHVSTTVAVAPTAPLLLVALKRTSHSIEFKWSPPASDGGSSIARYRLVYTTLMHRDVEDDPKRGGGGKKLQTVKEEFPASQTTCVIDDLQGNQVLSNVHVEAVNAADYLSPPSNSLRKVKTTPPSRIQIVKDEIRRIKKMKKKFVDSTVYHKFYQRFERETLLARLLVDLKELQDLELTKMESLREQDIQKAASKKSIKESTGHEKAEQHAESEDADTPNLQSSIFMAEDLMKRGTRRNRRTHARQTTIETMEALQMQEFHRREKQFEYRMNYLGKRFVHALRLESRVKRSEQNLLACCRT